MHPKAVLLALHGLRLCNHRGAKAWRIKRQHIDHERQLSWDSIEPIMHWRNTLAAKILEYTEQSWDDIPDAVMDELPQKLIDDFLSTF